MECRRLPTSHAFHSPMVQPIVDAFAGYVATVPRSNPTHRWISSLTGQPITDAEATDPRYWAQQMRQAVRFMDGIGHLMDPALALIEVGPGQALTSFARQHPDRKTAQTAVTSLNPGQDATADLEAVLAAVGKLWVAGLEIDWSAFNAGCRRHRIPLPTYPFERTRHWVDPAPRPSLVPAALGLPHPADAPMEEVMPDIPTPQQPATDHTAQVVRRLQALFAELSGMDTAALDPDASFLDLGLDSLFLTQASNALQKQFNVKVALRELLGECSTLDALASRLAPNIAPEPARAQQASVPVRTSPAERPAPPAPAAMTASSPQEFGALQQVLAQQLELMSRQLDMLRGIGVNATPPAPAVPAPAASVEMAPVPAPAPAKPAPQADRAPVAFGPYRPPARGASGGLTPLQEQHLRAFIERYVARTRGSKQFTADHRSHLADPRSVAGFRLIWKEMVYPIVVNRSSGSRLWDVDGNEYIDVTNGFGTILFGHNPEFVSAAIKSQLEHGMETGPQTPLAGEVARMVCEMTGMERAAFCSTGSEAVTAAIRVARTVTGRDRIVLFAGAYHGIFDEVLVRPTVVNGNRRSVPIAPGIAQSMVDNVVVLDYGSPESLQAIKAMGRELAAVLVEPVQSRRPDLQPRDFLLELRRITQETETPLIFDEVVTGFRTHPGGAQALFGIRADIATYGKVIGGGLPIGVVAGRALYLDALDGGAWRYGDQSSPEAGMTFF
ncbi:MAG TPA: aminotransferase class III-fold pyridoxal phosphate-dependent enzyme, partial [Longimicrobiales bacterium]